MVKRIVLTLVLLSLSATAGWAQKSKQPKPQPTGEKVLWREPTDIEARDLLNGPGGPTLKPDLSRVTFIKDQAGGGYSINYRVRDGAGNIWVAKLRSEAQPETAAVRLMWALGYMTEINYLVPCVRIEGAPSSSVKKCEGGGFANVKFEARPKDVKRLTNWQWASNPFSGTKELQGMIVLMSLMNNWDLKDDNNRILFVPKGSGGGPELQYILSDLGATFGKTGGFLSRSRNKPEDYVKSKFIEGVEGGRVKFSYGGKNSGLFNHITVEQAKWIGSWLARLSDKQLSDAFRAANYNPEEVQMLTAATRQRINQLVNLQ
jgi:hypothetical protein